ncbi:MAG: DmsC/YnfH family molybdoenzyme membrane anchor subunit [Myxococcota bacterium]
MSSSTLTEPRRLPIVDAPSRRPPVEPSLVGLLQESLREQSDLSGVERFSTLHEAGALDSMASRYSALLPATAPGPGQQYGFEVDLDACTGCKACVTACHTLNGLDDGEAWRDVGTLRGGSTARPVIQPVTTACHHCVEPACQSGCPVLAYEKDPVTGIVRHLDDQCIGCQYCVLKCPYDVPKYNAQRGIVRKCDMCSQRLAVGEPPACAQACPTGAIRVRVVSTDDVVEASEAGRFLPGSPDPIFTLPTTTFTSRQPLPTNMLAADHYRVHREHAHLPLVWMLVLTQMAVGAVVLQELVRRTADVGVSTSQSLFAMVVGFVALAASTLHLGRPHLAFRAVLGIRRSWLSREIVAFGGFAALSVGYAATHAWGGPAPAWLDPLGTMVCVVGLGAVACSAMVYHDTKRVAWDLSSGLPRFLLTTAILGVVALLVTSAPGSFQPIPPPWIRSLLLVLPLLVGLRLGHELLVLLHRHDRRHCPNKRTALLLMGELRSVLCTRVAFAAVGGIGLPAVLLWAADAPGIRVAADVPIFVGAIAALTFVGELLARYLFFVSVVSPKMPGGAL